MALNLYLDDCSNSDLLANLLRQAGHQVVRPTDKGVDLEGEDDDVHFAFAATHQLTIITKNAGDFLQLHQANSAHFGILAVYQDNDLSRDMSQAEIVKRSAISRRLPIWVATPFGESFTVSMIGGTEQRIPRERRGCPEPF